MMRRIYNNMRHCDGRFVLRRCANCLAKFEKDPKTYLAKIEAAKKPAAQP